MNGQKMRQVIFRDISSELAGKVLWFSSIQLWNSFGLEYMIGGILNDQKTKCQLFSPFNQL